MPVGPSTGAGRFFVGPIPVQQGRLFDGRYQKTTALRLPIRGIDHMVFVPAAGLPWFFALLGRDGLIVSLQTMLV
jgi:hypothetical protein